MEQRLSSWRSLIYLIYANSDSIKYHDDKTLKLLITLTSIIKYNQTGQLLEQIVQKMRKAEKNSMKKHEKVVFYSAHDATLLALLENLRIHETNIMPSYSSGIIFELHELQGRHFVKGYYYEGVTRDFTIQKLPNCDNFCNLDDFEKLVNDLVGMDAII
ncbi:hypothetical protein QAD02_006262 [Eretmocerus hayati]|uniref:Uncharacterized protein n=1 Tax=Eretmocerus hayati TaxID=131215 RepID=A0ACC2N0G2_9HYME|nr:hypothetical protein QAD02_006262 [Eretmocerus hayati]